MTIDRLTAQLALQRIREARAAVTALSRELTPQVRAAQNYTPPGFRATVAAGYGKPAVEGTHTSDQLRQLRAAEVDKVKAANQSRVDQLQALIKVDSELLEQAAAETARPGATADAAATQRSLMLWDQVRTQLEAGKPLRALLPNATPETVRAIAEFAPGWLALAKTPSHSTLGQAQPVDISAELRMIEDRVIETHPGEFAENTLAAREAVTVRDVTAPLLTNMQGVLAARSQNDVPDGLGAAVAAHFAAQSIPAEDELVDQGAS